MNTQRMKTHFLPSKSRLATWVLEKRQASTLAARRAMRRVRRALVWESWRVGGAALAWRVYRSVGVKLFMAACAYLSESAV